MSVLFNHARRYDLFDGNPIQFVRQSAKRRKIPHILTADEIDLLRHSSARLTLDTYTQAVTPAKREAQNAVLRLLIPNSQSAEMHP